MPSIVGGLDVHRKQITFDYLDTVTGEVSRGRVVPADRENLRVWLARRFPRPGEVALAVEGCTGWRYVVEELQRAGIEAHLAEPADTAAARGAVSSPASSLNALMLKVNRPGAARTHRGGLFGGQGVGGGIHSAHARWGRGRG